MVGIHCPYAAAGSEGPRRWARTNRPGADVSSTTSSRIRDLPFDRGRGDGVGRREVVRGLGASVPSGKVPGLSRDHRFAGSHGAHVDGLVRSRTGREHDSTGVEKGCENAFVDSSAVGPDSDGDDLKPHVPMDPLRTQGLRRQCADRRRRPPVLPPISAS